jgi:hypothetical protein
MIVDQLVDGWGAERDGGYRVWAELTLSPRSAPINQRDPDLGRHARDAPRSNAGPPDPGHAVRCISRPRGKESVCTRVVPPVTAVMTATTISRACCGSSSCRRRRFRKQRLPWPSGRRSAPPTSTGPEPANGASVAASMSGLATRRWRRWRSSTQPALSNPTRAVVRHRASGGPGVPGGAGCACRRAAATPATPEQDGRRPYHYRFSP